MFLVLFSSWKTRFFTLNCMIPNIIELHLATGAFGKQSGSLRVLAHVLLYFPFLQYSDGCVQNKPIVNSEFANWTVISSQYELRTTRFLSLQVHIIHKFWWCNRHVSVFKRKHWINEYTNIMNNRTKKHAFALVLLPLLRSTPSHSTWLKYSVYANLLRKRTA